MRDFGAYAVSVAIVLSVLCYANIALASQTTSLANGNITTLGTAPVGNDLSLIDIGGFLRLLGGFLRVGITGPSSGGGSSSSSPVCQGSGNNPGLTDAYGTTWHDLCVGAGGFLTGMDIAADGTKVVRTDTYGAYIWNGNEWQQLVTSASMPAGFVNIGENDGVYEIAIAPSNTNVFYMEYFGYVFKSVNRGTTWTQTNFAQVTDGSNDNYRTMGRKMAVDPANPNIVYVGTPGDGLFVTTNGGTSWSEVTGVATSTTPGYVIAFDPTSSVVGGATQGIYVGSTGTGVYHSTNGGQTWTLTSGPPTAFGHMIVAQDGTVYLSDGTDTNLWIYASGAWSSVSVSGNNGPLWAIAVDPTNANRVIAMNAGGSLSVSTNHGASFTGFAVSVSRVATDIPWLAWTNENYMTAGDIAFDPTQSNTLFFSEGIGVWTTSPSNTDSSVTWTSQSTGIEQLVANEVISPPGGHPLVASWDRPVFSITSPDVYPSTHGPNNAEAIVAGWSIDWASNDPSYIAAIMQGDTDESGYSTDGGQTWTQFGSIPADITADNETGGDIAAASSTDLVWIPSNSAQPYYSLDGGNTWTAVDPPGTTAQDSGWGDAYYLDRHIVTADRVNIGTFYAYNVGQGVYRSTDGGVTWTLVHSGELIPFDYYNAELQAVPDEAGNLFYTLGNISGQTLSDSGNQPFLRSTDGGATWNAVSNVYSVYVFGFGAPATPGGYPAIYIVGWVGSQFGVWRSDDNASTWTQIGLWPRNSLDQIRTITGDMNVYGRVYVGFGGSGYGYGDTSDAAPWIGFTAPTPTAAVNGSSVTLSAVSSGNVAISSVQFEVDGSDIGSPVTSAPYTTTWNSTGVPDGAHTLYAVAEGTSGKYATSSVPVTVENTPPTTPTNLSAVATSSSEIDLSWTASTDNNGVAGYQVFRNGSQVATSTLTAYADTGLTASTTYTYFVKAFDAVGNISGSSTSTSATTQNGVTWTLTASPAGIAQGSNVFDFGTQSIGPAASNRVVVVGVAGSLTAAVSAVSIGATSATEAANSSTSTTQSTSIWYASVTTGTSADIKVTLSSGGIGNLIPFVGYVDTGTPTPHSSQSGYITGCGTPTAATAAVPADGVGIAVAEIGGPNASIAWTGSSNDPNGDAYTTDSGGNGLSGSVAHAFVAGNDTIEIATPGCSGGSVSFTTWSL